MTEYAVETFKLTKRFKKARKLPINFHITGQWIVGGLLKLAGREAEEITAVDHVDLKIRKGEFFGLIGPNGAGKTTLIKCLSTLLIPDEGTALVNGYDIREEPEGVKLSINLVGSGTWMAFDWGLTVKENLEFFAGIYGLDPSLASRRIKEALSIVGLEEKANEYPGKLSSGMRQKMLVAKGFLLRTPIFFLDEPTVGLDPGSAREIRSYIKNILSKELKETILLTTHYMFEAEELCDRIAIMNHGRIIACDTPANLRRLIKRVDVIEIEAVNLDPYFEDHARKVELVDSVAVQILDDVTGRGFIRVHTPDHEEVLPDILELTRRMGIKVEYVDIVQPTLEDVFISLTGGKAQ